MKNSTHSIVAAVAFSLAAAVAPAGEVRVSPGGLSPAEAVARIRRERPAGDTSVWTVRIGAGEHFLPETLTLTPADSHLAFVGEPGAVLTGGRPIGPWKDDGGGVWSAPVPRDASGNPVWFEMLFVNGRRAARARHPSTGFFRISAFTNFCVKTAGGKDRWIERCTFSDPAVAKALSALPADELDGVHMCVDIKWCYARRLVRGWDPASGTVETWGAVQIPSWGKWSAGMGSAFAFENVPAGFDDPGEWFYDRRGAVIRYRPLPGEDIATLRAVAPTAKASTLLAVKGDIGAKRPVTDVTFSNIAFELADAPSGCAVTPGGPVEFRQYQAAANSDAAIMLEGAEDVVFDECAVRRTGNYAMRIGDGCRRCTVRRCVMEDIGAGGVWIGAGAPHVGGGKPLSRRRIAKSELAPRSTAFVTVEDCTIRNAGAFNPEGTGVVIGHASDGRVEHNDIGDLFYTGVSVGWVWGYGGSPSQRNTVAFNRIHDLGKGRMSDMGGVYTLGTSYGTCVSNNVIWNVVSGGYGGWALYCDEGSEGVVMENNLCYDTDDGGFHQHYGADNLVRNNIFAYNQRAGAIRTYREYGLGDALNSVFVYRNVVYVKGSPLVSENACRSWGVWACNLWFDCAADAKPLFAGLDWAGWQACGKEVGGVYADPLFVDPEARDFRLRPESPAFRLGFRPWDMSQAGVRRKAQ